MEDLHLLCGQLNPGRGVCGSASESRCHLGSSGVSLLILDHHGIKITSSPVPS